MRLILDNILIASTVYTIDENWSSFDGRKLIEFCCLKFFSEIVIAQNIVI